MMHSDIALEILHCHRGCRAGVVSRRRRGARRAQSTPDTENGRYALSPVADGVLRLDTRTGAVSTCNNSGAGWACYAVPDERAALDAEIGRLQADNEKLKAQLAAREPTVAGKIDEPLPKIGFAEEARAEGRRGRAQDRNPAAERPRHGSHDVVPGAGLAAADRDGQPGAEGRQRQDLSTPRTARLCEAGPIATLSVRTSFEPSRSRALDEPDSRTKLRSHDRTQIALPHRAVHRHRHHHRVLAADGADAAAPASPISPPRSQNSCATPARARAR